MRKCFYFNDYDVLEHLSKQKNQSEYVTNLIKKDMNNDIKIDELLVNLIVALLRISETKL